MGLNSAILINDFDGLLVSLCASFTIRTAVECSSLNIYMHWDSYTQSTLREKEIFARANTLEPQNKENWTRDENALSTRNHNSFEWTGNSIQAIWLSFMLLFARCPNL